MGNKSGVQLSPSSRRAWVEIANMRFEIYKIVSPSSRRAWVEIPSVLSLPPAVMVALLAEGVGRNVQDALVRCRVLRRPPRGGRG